MNRCVRPDQNTAAARRAALGQLLAGAGAAALAVWAVPARAGQRVFPVDTRRGLIDFINPPQVHLDGRPERLGPGTRIHDARGNRLVFAGTLKGQSLTVNYVRGGAKTIREIWILTPSEIQEKLPPTQEELNRARQSRNIEPPRLLN
jgi:hypothetical protein